MLLLQKKNSQSAEFLERIAARAESNHDLPKGNLHTYFIRRLVFELMRGISDSIHGKLVKSKAGPHNQTFDRLVILDSENWNAD